MLYVCMSDQESLGSGRPGTRKTRCVCICLKKESDGSDPVAETNRPLGGPFMQKKKNTGEAGWHVTRRCVRLLEDRLQAAEACSPWPALLLMSCLGLLCGGGQRISRLIKKRDEIVRRRFAVVFSVICCAI